MANYTTFRLKSGAVISVETSRTPPAPPAGLVQASGLEEKARETWEQGVDLVREMAEDIVTKLKQATAAADEVGVEFGVNISGKTGIVLVEGTVGANLKVNVKWKKGA